MAGELIEGMTEKWAARALRRQVHRRDQGAAGAQARRPARPRRSSRWRRHPRARGIERHRPRRAAQEEPRQARRRRRQGQGDPARGPPRTGQEARAKARLTSALKRASMPHGATDCPERPARTLRRQARLRGHLRAEGRPRRSGARSCPSSSRSTPRRGCTTTSASSSTACCCAGRCPRGRASTRPTSAWPCTSRTIRSPTAPSKARSRRSSTAPASVIVWDRGTWEPVGDPREGMAKGKLVFQPARREARRASGSW